MIDQAELPDVTIFSLGGTIAATNDGPQRTSDGVTPQLDAGDLVAAVPQLASYANVRTASFRQVPSGDLNLDDLVALAREIMSRFEAGDVGVVVTQGTDTLEETSFALDLLVHSPRVVVVTGAMRNPTVSGADGPANLLAAVQVAAAPGSRGLGTVVVANDEIHAARFVRKTHSSSPGTFRSPSAGPLGWVIEDRPRIVMRVTTSRGLALDDVGPVPPVALLTALLGDDMRLVARIEEMGYVGLVIEAFGGGHVPGDAVSGLAELAARVPVVFASRTGSGELLRDTYGSSGSERDLLARGLISAGVLDGRKARVLVSLLLASGRDRDAVRKAFRDFNESVSSFDD